MTDRHSHLHILGIGQSNLASHGEVKSTSEFGAVLFNDQYLPMKDPISGGTGKGGSIWPRFADQLNSMEKPPQLLLSLLAQGGTSVRDWAAGGKCNSILQAALPNILVAKIPVNLVVWHQGERDTLLETSKNDYVESFKSLYDSLSEHIPDISWIICRASHRMGVRSKSIVCAQDHIISSFPNCFSGPNTDDMGDDYRFDRTHLNEKGLDKFSKNLFKSYTRSF